jgi:hypothetical protein
MKKLFSLIVVLVLMLIASLGSLKAAPLSERLNYILIAYDATYSEIPEMQRFGPLVLAEAAFQPGVPDDQIKSVTFRHVPTKVSYVAHEGFLITEAWGFVPYIDYSVCIGRGDINTIGKWKVTVKYTDGTNESHTLYLTHYETPPPPIQVNMVKTPNGNIVVRWFANCGDPEHSAAGYRIRIWDEDVMVHQEYPQGYDGQTNTVTFEVPAEYSGCAARLENRLRHGGAILDSSGSRDAGWSRALLWVKLP